MGCYKVPALSRGLDLKKKPLRFLPWYYVLLKKSFIRKHLFFFVWPSLTTGWLLWTWHNLPNKADGWQKQSSFYFTWDKHLFNNNQNNFCSEITISIVFLKFAFPLNIHFWKKKKVDYSLQLARGLDMWHLDYWINYWIKNK